MTGMTMFRPGSRTLITDVEGVLVGNVEDPRLRSGLRVVFCEAPAVASVDVRGGAPGTRETDLLDPAARNERIDAICLSGGSAFGLSAADGVMRWLKERGRGVPVAGAVVPIVPTAILFDLLNGGDKNWDWPPYRELAYAAAGKAGADFALGNAGAGRLAVRAQDGLARAIRPVHTPQDGDTVFAIATGQHDLGGDPRALAELGTLAADCLARAVARGVYNAATLGAARGWRDVFGR